MLLVYDALRHSVDYEGMQLTLGIINYLYKIYA